MRLDAERSSTATLFLNMGPVVGQLLANSKVAESWEQPSALEGMSVGALAAHLGRAFTTAAAYLGEDECEVEEDIDASEFYLRALDRSAEELLELNVGISQRAADDARLGPAEILRRHKQTLEDLSDALASSGTKRGIRVFDGICMTLDSYLVTRMVEAVVHSDDLAHSVDIDTPHFETDAIDVVLVTLLGIARNRNGDQEVIRQFTRAERSNGQILPVL